mmetsp:Transcript_55842/g.173106  ORF Transcript_55842/g.173106 Transcript_55842/m.173106 type:complete len:309 (+) Transcript_55842:157-1083(+)
MIDDFPPSRVPQIQASLATIRGEKLAVNVRILPWGQREPRGDFDTTPLVGLSPLNIVEAAGPVVEEALEGTAVRPGAHDEPTGDERQLTLCRPAVAALLKRALPGARGDSLVHGGHCVHRGLGRHPRCNVARGPQADAARGLPGGAAAEAVGRLLGVPPRAPVRGQPAAVRDAVAHPPGGSSAAARRGPQRALVVAGLADVERAAGPAAAPAEVEGPLSLTVHDEGAADVAVDSGRVQTGDFDGPVVAPHPVPHAPDPLLLADLLLFAVVEVERLPDRHCPAKVRADAVVRVPPQGAGVHIALHGAQG